MAAKKFVRLVTGRLKEIAGVVTSAGAGNDGDIPALNAGGILDDTIINASVTSAANKIAKLDGSGRLDSGVMPVGIGADTKTITASEALSAGDFVNVWDDSGTAKVRKADATAEGKEADGFVLAAVSNGASATVYFEGSNNQLSSLTRGARYYLHTTAGGVTTTPPSSANNVVQYLGKAISTTEISFEPGEPVTVA